ncbi:colanic acid biosynthesis glycosyltransferase WcaE [compost metagenome]
MADKLLSIVTVSYKNIDGLRKTFNSLRALLQAYPNSIQWIVVDAASNDGTLEFLIDTKNQYHNISFISEKDRGIYDAMNKGVTMASHKYIWFLNAGDTSMATDELLINLNTHHDALFFGAYYEYGRYKYYRPPKPLGYATYGMPANHQAIFYKKEVLERNPYPLSFGLSQDYWLSTQLLSNNSTYHIYDKPIVKFEVGGISTTNYLAVCSDMAKIQREVLKLNRLKIFAFYLRRVVVMTANYLIHRATEK